MGLMSLAALVGGQFGSEGKGLIAGHIANEYGHHVRVGAANAGHTVYTPVHRARSAEAKGDDPPWFEKHVMQQIPCAAYANPEARLYIGPGAQISPEIFEDELVKLTLWRREKGLPEAEIFVDPRAHVITDVHIEREQQSGLAERIGSTSTIAREGIGAAQAARVMRDESCVTAAEWYEGNATWFHTLDVPVALSQRVKRDNYHVLLEGTQGTGLSLTTGFFPFTTSRNTTAAGLCADTGVPPNHLDKVILVCRTFPIRVAGNSGPFYSDSSEIDWEDIGIDSENERTTVTKKVRRVATFSLTQVVDAAAINGATDIALTFADYIEPQIAGRTDERDLRASKKLQSLIDDIQVATNRPVSFVGTGPHSVIDLR